MHVNPDLQDAKISDCLFHQYGLQVSEIAFLPQGGDINTAVYRVVTGDEAQYFLKLRRGVLDEIALTVPCFLRDRGIRQIIAPIASGSGRLWTQLDDSNVILYPFVEGQNAFDAALTERQWFDFGVALQGIHTAVVPPELRDRVQHEIYSPQFREKVQMLMGHAQRDAFDDPIAAQYSGLMASKADEILYIVRRAEQLGSILQAQDPQFVLCHSDIHAGNLLIDANGSLYIVDWDYPIMAAKERDLMFIGGGVGSIWSSPGDEALFYKGYGQAEINRAALAYYRFERIVQDIAEWGERILMTRAGGQERMRWLGGLVRWFQPNDVVHMAYQADKALPADLKIYKV